MKKKDIYSAYRKWRKEHENKKPNRVIVKMRWEDEEEERVDTIALQTFDFDVKDDCYILFYCPLNGLYSLTKPNNGSDFILLDVLEFYKI
jgi:hypothetical protein